MTLGNIGEVELKRRDYAAAIDHLTQALSIVETRAPDPSVLGEFHFALAQARWSGNRDHDAARALGERARADYASLPGRQKELVEIDAWLASRADRR